MLQETRFQVQVLKPCKPIQESSNEVLVLKLDSFLTLFICRGFRFLEFQYDFLGIREFVFGLSFLLTLDI